MSKTFRSYPNSYEVIEHLQDELQAELDNLEKEKKDSIRWWSDDRYARYDTKKYIYKQQIRHLKKLLKEVELAELNDELAYDGAMDYQEPPF